jgi:hypothetical protein
VTDDRWLEGDASVHLEDLVVGELPEMAVREAVAQLVAVEMVGPNLRMSGSINIGQFRRLSDFLNNFEGLVPVREATILRRTGEATQVRTQGIWVAPTEVTLFAQTEEQATPSASDLQVPKVAVPLVIVTPGHTLTGEVYITPDADIGRFIESPSPTYVAMTDVRTRSLADRRVRTRYAFAVLNRRHIVAATQLSPGMARDRDVL